MALAASAREAPCPGRVVSLGQEGYQLHSFVVRMQQAVFVFASFRAKVRPSWLVVLLWGDDAQLQIAACGKRGDGVVCICVSARACVRACVRACA